MARTQSTQFALATTSFGVLAFLLGIFAELKKPPHGTPIKGKDMVICQFPHDPTVALGTLSTLAAACCAGIGDFSVFFPYNGKSVPRKALLDYTLLYVFFHLAMHYSGRGRHDDVGDGGAGLEEN